VIPPAIFQEGRQFLRQRRPHQGLDAILTLEPVAVDWFPLFRLRARLPLSPWRPKVSLLGTILSASFRNFALHRAHTASTFFEEDGCYGSVPHSASSCSCVPHLHSFCSSAPAPPLAFLHALTARPQCRARKTLCPAPPELASCLRDASRKRQPPACSPCLIDRVAEWPALLESALENATVESLMDDPTTAGIDCVPTGPSCQRTGLEDIR